MNHSKTIKMQFQRAFLSGVTIYHFLTLFIFILPSNGPINSTQKAIVSIDPFAEKLIFINIIMIEPSPRKRYKKVNGCTKQFQCEQIFWIFGMIAIITIYSVFTVPPIIKWGNIPMIVFMAVIYLGIVIMIIDYLILTVVDPVDKCLKGIKSQEPTKMCSVCKCEVQKTTYHCIKCKRCTYKMDHHSMLVNNCISLTHISNYIRMNICFVVSSAGIAAQSITIFAYSYSESQLNTYILNRWPIIIVGIMTALCLPISITNLFSTCYIKFSKQMPKIEYIYRQRSSNHSQIESSEQLGTDEKKSDSETQKGAVYKQ